MGSSSPQEPVEQQLEGSSLEDFLLSLAQQLDQRTADQAVLCTQCEAWHLLSRMTPHI